MIQTTIKIVTVCTVWQVLNVVTDMTTVNVSFVLSTKLKPRHCQLLANITYVTNESGNCNDQPAHPRSTEFHGPLSQFHPLCP